MQIVNLTPHSINFIVDDHKVTIAPSGSLARVSSQTATTGSLSYGDVKIPVTETVYGAVEGLPAPKEDTIYIVSSLVASRCKDRRDVFIPNESVRDAQGRIIGCRSLGRV